MLEVKYDRINTDNEIESITNPLDGIRPFLTLNFHFYN